MKLHPPEVKIPEEDPFKNALFNRKEFAQSLTALLRNVEESMVIFVNAPWGEGKTTFAKMWQTHLKNGEKLIDVIRFDAYAADYFDDPFVSFTGEILELVKRRLDEAKGVEAKTREFREAAVGVLKQLGSLGVKVGLRSITMGAVDLSNLTALKSVGDDLAEGISEIGEKLLEKKIEGYAKEKEALAQFKKTLGDLAKLVRDEQGFPLTIIVDELDRCRPDFALQLLERIKHLFDVGGVAFVLLVNQEQIESYVRTIYGEQVKATAYLQKFGTLFVDLPRERSGVSYAEDRLNFCRNLCSHFGVEKHVREPRTLAVR